MYTLYGRASNIISVMVDTDAATGFANGKYRSTSTQVELLYIVRSPQV